MAEKTIRHASFWYINKDGVEQSAIRGDKVDIPNETDLERGERLEAFATDDDLAEGSEFAGFLATRAEFGMADPATAPAKKATPADVKPASRSKN